MDPIKLSVANFGPIVEAAVDLRPLTVFVGPSNTGKSYLAILIYALHRFLGRRDIRYRHQRIGNYPISLYRRFSTRRRRMSRKNTEIMIDWAKKFTNPESDELHSHPPILLPFPINSLINSMFTEMDEANVYLNEEIRRCFGVEKASQLIRHGTSDCAHINLQTDISQISPSSIPLNFDFSMKQNTSKLSATLHFETTLRFDDDIRRFVKHIEHLGSLSAKPMQNDARDLATYIGYDLAEAVILNILGPFSRFAFYLPADRAGIMHSHRAVVGTLVERAAMAGIRRATQVPQLSGVLADFLEHLIALDGRTRKGKLGEQLAQYLEKDILDGSVHTEHSETGYPSFTYLPKKWKQSLPLMNTSSMVSELAPIALYLRHFVDRGDVLIIEEPESHLHPAMQAALARQIAHFVNSGIRVIVTTHSEWLLDQFANMVRLSSLPERRRHGINGAEDALRPDQFGAWLFKPKRRPKGSVVEEIKVEPDSGGLISGYEDVAEELYNTWSKIGNRVADYEAGQEN